MCKEQAFNSVRFSKSFNVISLVSKFNVLIIAELNASSLHITSLKGLEHAQDLETLDVSYNQITDFSPLSQLAKLNQVKIEY